MIVSAMHYYFLCVMRCGVYETVTGSGGGVSRLHCCYMFSFTALESTEEIISFLKENFGSLSSEVKNNKTLNLIDQHGGECINLLRF